MSDFAARVFAVEAIRQHPHADGLTVVKLVDHPDELIANKNEDGSFRYVPGVDLVVLIPVGAILKRWLMEKLHVWDYGKGKGMLGGNRKDRVIARKFPALDGGEERFESRGMLKPVGGMIVNGVRVNYVEGSSINVEREVEHGDDVTELLEIVEHKVAA